MSRSMPKYRKDLGQGLFAITGGVNIAAPMDRLKPGEYQILRNVREYTAGEIRTRPGIAQVSAVAIADTNVHSGRQLNDSTGQFAKSFGIFLGAGNNLYQDNAAHNAFSQVTGTLGTGYSGSPLLFNPFRPNQSPDPWFYIGDANKNAKVRVDGLAYRQGIIPPQAPPTGIVGATIDPNPTINPFQVQYIDTGDGTSGSWSGTGVYNPVGDVSSVGHTVTAFIADTGVTPGWASVVVTPPGTSSEFYQPGWTLFIQNETVVIDSIFPAMNKATTIASITYDAGSSGPATIVMSNARKNVVANSVILFSGTNEYARIQSVSVGKDGLPSIRVTTVSTYVAGAAITGVFSWRAYFLNSHAGANYNLQNLIAGTFTPLAPGASGTGTATKTVTLDLSSVNGRPLQDTDFLNLELFLDVVTPPLTTEVQFRINLGTAGTDYYLVAVRPSDFSSITGTTPATSTLLAQQRKIQRDIIGSTPITPDLSSGQQFQRLITKVAKLTAAGQQKRANRVQARLDRLSAAQQIGILPDGGGGPIGGGGSGTGGTSGGSGGSGGGGHHHKGGSGGGTGGGGTGTGSGSGTGAPSSSAIAISAGQFVQVKIQIKDVARVGTDNSLTWANVTSVQFTGTYTNSSPILTLFPSLSFGGIWVGGTFGPTAGPTSSGVATTPYLYRCGFRSTTTGARSNPGPATRNGVTPNNSQVQLTLPTSPDGQVDKADVFRFGGTINAWKLIGSGAPGAQFNDSLPDIEVLSAPNMMFDLSCPWPLIDIPRQGTCNVSGTMVTFASGSSFNVNWDQDTEILINGVSQSIYRVISTSLLEIVHNAGNQTGVTFELPDPVIIANALPALWGPFGTGKFGQVMFGCGSTLQPEMLSFSNADDPDSAGDVNQVEVTTPSEPLVNGFIYDSRAGVFSTERMFEIFEAFDPITNSQYFTTQGVPNSKGLWSRFAMCVTPYGIAFLSKDGLYLTTGAAPVPISSNLYPIFPHDGIVGVTTGAYNAVDMTQTDKLRLSYIDGRLEFWYKDSGNTTRTWIGKGLETGSVIWESNDDYNPQINVSFPAEGLAVHARYLCGTDGRLYKSVNTADDQGAAISCQVRSRSDNLGDSRVFKKFGDVSLDMNTNNVTVNVVAGFDLYNTLLASAPKSNASRNPPLVLDLQAGGGVLSRDIVLDFTWSTSVSTVFLYEWQPNYFPKEDSTFLRATTVDNLGTMQPKLVQGIRLWADTGGVARTIKVQADNGLNGLMQDQSPAITLAPNHNGESIIAYPNASGGGWVPFICHLVRLLPTDTNNWELFDYEWIFEPAPEIASQWFTPQTTFDNPNFQFIRDYSVAHFSTADITLVTTYDDASTSTYTIVNGAGAYKKSYFPSVAKKFKAVSFNFTSTAPFRLVLKDSTTRIGVWGGQGPLRTVLPFGDVSRGTADGGARV